MIKSYYNLEKVNESIANIIKQHAVKHGLNATKQVEIQAVIVWISLNMIDKQFISTISVSVSIYDHSAV